MRKKSRNAAAVLCSIILFSLSVCGCGKKEKGVQSGADGAADASDAAQEYRELSASELFSGRDYEIGYDESSAVSIVCNGQTAECASASVQVESGAVTIGKEGTYLLSGQLDGMIIVDADKKDKVQLVLNDIRVSSVSSAAVYVRSADKVFITTAADSENVLVNGGSFAAIDDNNIDAVIFSKEDLTLNGQGSLSVESPAGHGIVSKDDLKITSGSYVISAASHGICGKDSVRIAGGTFEITAGKHGIHADNADDEALGSVYLLGGAYRLTVQEDGINASCHVQINGGSFEITAKDDGIHADQTLTVTDGNIAISKCYEGLEGLHVIISGGEIDINATDDGINAAGGRDGSGMGRWDDIPGGSWGDFPGGGFDGMPGDFPGGGFDGMPDDIPSGGFEGMPDDFPSGGFGEMPDDFPSGGFDGMPDDFPSGGFDGMPGDVPDGGFDVVADQRPGGGNFGGFGGRPNMGDFGGFGGDSSGSLEISGGTITIRAAGDALDANGSISVTGGTIVTCGPNDGDTSILDFDTSGTISGGSFFGTGASFMPQNFDASSAQGAIMVLTGRQAAGTTVTLTDAEGKVLMSQAAGQAFSCVIVSCDAIKAGNSYTLTAGSYTQTVTMEGTVYTPAGAGGGPGGFGGRPGAGGSDGRGGRNKDKFSDGESTERPGQR